MAQHMCRILGCGEALSAPKGAHFGRGHGPIWLAALSCNRTSAFINCSLEALQDIRCILGGDAGVVCSVLRLVNGPNRCSGRIEVLHNEVWGTVCDAGWDLHDVQVVCKELNCGNASKALAAAWFGEGYGPIWLQRVNCTGNEAILSECPQRPWGEHRCSHNQDASVECSGVVRLVSGRSHCSGRVEVLHNHQWGTVCDDDWDLNNAQVVCRELGCGDALSAPGKAMFGKGHGPIWLDDVKCEGTETSLNNCYLKNWEEHNCYHGEDAGVVCSELRLVNGRSQCSGRIEVLHNHQWGTICDSGWDLLDAHVVCRELDCGNPGDVLAGEWYGQGSGPIWLENVNCMGNEASLFECPQRPWGEHNCSHSQDVNVECAVPIGIRLVNGSSRCSGRVEVFYENTWGTVCDDDWDLDSAQVVCRELGCGAALSAPTKAHFGAGPGPIWLGSAVCRGMEESLIYCDLNMEEHDCSHKEDAGVVCSELRLVNGQDSCSGRIEVFHNEEWGTVCDDGWDLYDAQIVCKALDCGSASKALAGAWFGEGSGRIWLDGVNCTGKEAILSECTGQPWGEHSCTHSQDASVECSDRTEIRLVDGSYRCSGRVEVLHKQQKGVLCNDEWNLNSAQVVCRELGCGVALLAPLGNYFQAMEDFYWLQGVRCQGTEASIRDCELRDWGENYCYHGSNAGAVCSGEVRLVNGSSRCSGRVEVLRNHSWGAVCEDGWDLNGAQVVCRELGCGAALSATTGTHFGRGHGPVSLEGITCNGMEAALKDCPLKAWKERNCSHGEGAAVVCSELRLVNGTSQCSGRIEVLHNHQWGTICDSGWDLLDGHVVCRELNCGSAIEVLGGAQFGQGSGPIWLERINCLGKEVSLSECPQRPWGEHSCDHSQDASVVCSADTSGEINIHLRLAVLVLFVLVLIVIEAVYSSRRGHL